MNNYIICTVQRSGKSWIAQTLNMLGMGYALELLTEFERDCAPGQDRLRPAFDADGMAGLARSFAHVRREQGLPCASATFQHINLSLIEADRQPQELLAFVEALSPCLVFFLKREDILLQAISHFLMMGSNYIHSTCCESRRPERAKVPYNRAEIDRYMNFTRRSYRGWEAVFEKASIVPEVLFYEHFVEDPIRKFAALAERISGRSFAPETISSAAACQSKISDETDDILRARYLAETQQIPAPL